MHVGGTGDGVSRGSTASTRGGSSPASRSSIRDHSTVCVSATLWPHNAIASQWSTSVYEPGCPSVPKDALSADGGGRSAQPGVAVHVRRADASLPDDPERVVVLERRAVRSCRSRCGPIRHRPRGAPGNESRPAPSRRPRSTRRGRRLGVRMAGSGDREPAPPASRTGPSVRAGPCSPGRSTRPRTPTMRSPRTAISKASPLLCSTDALCTHLSTSSMSTPGARTWSTRTGQGSARPYRVLAPQGSAMRSMCSSCVGGPLSPLAASSARSEPRARRAAQESRPPRARAAGSPLRRRHAPRRAPAAPRTRRPAAVLRADARGPSAA